MQTCDQAYRSALDLLQKYVQSNNVAAALHLIQDAYAPGHYGFQPLIPLKPYIVGPGLVSGIAHLAGDFTMGPGVSQAIVASAAFLTDLMSGSPIDPARYFPTAPCGK